MSQNPCTCTFLMYRINSVAMNKVENFDLHMIDRLPEENKWVQLAGIIPI